MELKNYYKGSPWALALRCLCAFAMLLPLRVIWEIGAGLETGNFIVDNLSKFANQFYSDGIADMFIFTALFLLLGWMRAHEDRLDLPSLLLAGCFALLYVIGNVCIYVGNFSFFFANLYQLCLTALLLLGLSMLFYCLIRLFYRFVEKAAPEKEQISHPLLKGAGIIFLCWLPWLLMNYPASLCPDATGQINQWLGIIPWSAHHPPFSTLIMGLCISVGEFIWNRNFGLFLYVLFQSVTGAFIFSYMLMLLHEMGLSRKGRILMLLFFASPFWALFAQWFEKDFLYAQVFALCICFMLPVIKSRRCSVKDALRIAAAALAAILLRKTGTYELVPALLLLGLWLKKSDRLRMLLAALAVLILSQAVNNGLYPAMGIEKASAREALSIPFQQTARYVNQFPDEVTAEERAAIDAVLVYDELYKYDPKVSDPVKNNYRENGAALPEYFKVWFQMLLKHPLCYFEAGFMQSFGYLAPVQPSMDAYILSTYYPGLEDIDIYRAFGDFPTRAFDSLRHMFASFPLTNMLCMAGVYTWLLLLSLVWLLRRKCFGELILLLPCCMNVLICIASPLAASTRYELPVIACAPIMLGLMLAASKAADRRGRWEK